jgi:hypothetical protein
LRIAATAQEEREQKHGDGNDSVEVRRFHFSKGGKVQ